MDDQDLGQAPAPTASPRRTSPRLGGYRYSVGRVLGRSFTAYGRYLIPLLALSAALHAPVVLWMQSALAEDVVAAISTTEEANSLARRVSFLTAVLSRLIPVFLQIVVTYAVFQTLSGKRGAILQSVRAGTARFVPVFVVALLFAVITSAAPMLLDATGMHGFMLIAGIIAAVIACTYFVAVQACIVERLGVGESFRRSAELTRGSRGGIFLTYLVLGMLAVVVGTVGALALIDLDAVRELATFDEMRDTELLALVVSAVLTPLLAVCAAVVYHDLRMGKEGVVADDLASVFD